MEFRVCVILNRISCNLKDSVTILMIFPNFLLWEIGECSRGISITGGGELLVATHSNIFNS